MAGRIRIGSIGIGGIANGVHIPGILASKDLELKAICDNNPAALEAAQKKYGIDSRYCFTDYNDLINCPEVDAIDITTPNDVHFPIALAAAKSGKPFSLEKPITLTSEQADILADTVKKYGNKNMVCFSYRFKSASRYARDLVRQGVIGDVRHIYGQFLQGWGDMGFGGKPAPLMWRFIKERTGTGALGDLGSHILDLASFVSGKNILKIMAHGDTIVKERPLPDGSGMGTVDVDDFCHMLAMMEDHVSATFEVSRFAYGRDHQRLEIYGTKGALIYSNHGLYGCKLEACVGAPYTNAQQMNELVIPAQYKADQMQAFADLINGNPSEMTASIIDGMINQHVLTAAEKSFESGEWVEVK